MFRVPGHLGTRGPMARTPHHGSAALALGVVVVLLLAGCGDGGTEDPGPRAHVTTSTTQAAAPSSTASDVSTSTPSTPEEQVKAAYVDAMVTYYQRLVSPDPNDPRLREVFAGALLEHAVQRNTTMLAAGEQMKFTERGVPTPTDITIDAINGDSATVTACLVNDAIRYRASDGAVVDNAVVSVRYQADLQLSANGWRVIDQRVMMKAPSGAGCNS